MKPSIIRQILSPDGQATVEIVSSMDKLLVNRIAIRNKVINSVDKYEFVDKDYNSTLIELDLDHANIILDRIASGKPYASSYIFYENDSDADFNLDKSDMEHRYTSTGIKFWRHQEAMLNYKNDNPNSIISTHVSPEGACNLKCPYCSVTYRDTHSRIELEVIQDYIDKLITRGLKAVILTGGGEPTVYKQFNELVKWIKRDKGLSVALITNGTQSHRVDCWDCFSWVRVSINIFEKWEEKIQLPVNELSQDCIVGCSMVYTVEHEKTSEQTTDRLDIFKKVSNIADKVNSQYIRLLPNCLLEQKDLLIQHRSLENTLLKLNDKRFFHQHKVHRTPVESVCHQSYFRPYLSEEPYHKDGRIGAVFPCDSVVLNDAYTFFAKEYQICHASEILDFLDRKIELQFDPRKRCKGCVFTDNVDMLGAFKRGEIDKFDQYTQPLKHQEFV